MTEVNLQVKTVNGSIISQFIEQILESNEIRNYLDNRKTDETSMYKKTVQNLQLFDDKKQTYFRLRDVAIIIGISMETASRKIKNFDFPEVVKSTVLDSKNGKGEYFLSEAGVIRFIYNSRGPISKFLCRIFTNIILSVCQDRQLFASVVRQTVYENPEEALEFFDSLEERCQCLRDLYDQEREKNIYLERVNKVIHSKLIEEEYKTIALNEENTILSETMERIKYESDLMSSDDLLSQMMSHYMTPVYVQVLSTRELEKVFPQMAVPPGYQSKYEFSLQYKAILEGIPLGYKITTEKGKSHNHVKIEYAHSISSFKEIKEEIENCDSFKVMSLKGPITVYGQYELIAAIFQKYHGIFPKSKTSL